MIPNSWISFLWTLFLCVICEFPCRKKWLGDMESVLYCCLIEEWKDMSLTHWGRVTHICISKLTTIGSDNGLSPGRCQAIIWTNGEILLIGPLATNFSEILIEIRIFSFKKMHLKMSSGKWRPSCLGLNVLTHLPLAAILQTIFSCSFSWMKSFPFWLKFHWN